jgi:hypothetical protein
MKQIIITFSLIFLTLTSCKENKLDTKKEPAAPIATPNLSTAPAELKLPEIIPYAFELYQLNDLEENTGKKMGFISLSDNCPLSDHKDSMAIPNLDNVQDEKERRFLILTSKYRKRLLDRTGIAESDSVFIYDYTTDVLRSFAVKNLNTAANQSVYSYGNNDPLTQYDYQIGFAIDKNLLKKMGIYHCFVSIGTQNPFERGQMKPILWKKMDTKEFPFSKSNLKKSKVENTYVFSSGQYQYYLQDFKEKATNNDPAQRHLIVVDRQNKKVITERIFSESEGTSLTPLSTTTFSESETQWTGKLLKNKPEVVFGFEYFSFGCPNIIFLDPQEKDIDINCDNRH